MTESSNPPLFVEDLAPWNDNPHSIWLASTLQLYRNVDKFHFPAKLSPDKRKQLVSFLGKEAGKLKEFKQPTLIKSEESSPVDKEFLVEHCMTNEGFTQAAQGEAFFFDKSGECLLSFNVEDHIHFHYMDTKGELERSFSKLANMEAELGKTVVYAYSTKFGFLTSNPAVCGTGLVATLFLQLSGLIHSGKLNETLENLKDEAVEVQGLLGGGKDWVGDIAQVSNQYSLGVNEESILSSLRNFSTRLIAEETAERERLKVSSEMKDKVARAFGLLIHSYQIETVEALNEIALLKFGLEMGWIQGTDMNTLNRLFFTCRRGHLLRYLGGKTSMEEVPHKRAEFIHTALKNVTIAI
ncbi:MAG: protein arginine kinase [Parachlamydiaceae bacterium]